MDYTLTSFTPWSALAGGVVIGLSAALYLLGVGRIAGIAGIVAASLRGLISGRIGQGEQASLAFLFGLLAAPWVWAGSAPLPETRIDTDTLGLVLAGLLVGVGVRLGNGCTSGHGVCGLSRLSVRSAINVLSFMGGGFITVFLTRHIL